MALEVRDFRHSLSIADAHKRCDQALDHYRKLYPFYAITVDWTTPQQAKVNIKFGSTPGSIKISCDLQVTQATAKLSVTYPDTFKMFKGTVNKYIDQADREIRSWLTTGGPAS
jgi:hypothetical protein